MRTHGFVCANSNRSGSAPEHLVTRPRVFGMVRGEHEQPDVFTSLAAIDPEHRSVGLAGAAVLGFGATYLIAVRTARGQFLDLLALSGQRVQVRPLVESAKTFLGTISVGFVFVTLVGVLVVGVVRRQLRASVIVGGMVVGAVVSAELLKRELLHRPILVPYSDADVAINTLPSGHSTVAMCVAVVVVLLAPKRWQFLAGIVATPYAVGIGIATVVAHWHRPSDVVAAWFVVAFWTFMALAALRTTGCIEVDKGALWGRLIRPGMFALVGVATIVLAITTLVSFTVNFPAVPAGQHTAALRSVFAFGFSLASIAAVGAAFVGALLWMLRDLRFVAADLGVGR